MTIVGLTGGIGSGKTTVANFFEDLRVPVYFADIEAKKLMNRSKVLQRKIKALFGEEAYVNNELNRPYLASKIFNNENLLQKMNAIVHPKVGKHFDRWVKNQNAPYVIKEAAVIFENDSYKNYDFIITVVADKKARMKRILKRDLTTQQKIKAIMKNQWVDSKKVRLSDFVINNKSFENTREQVDSIHRKLLNLSN
ncbi:MAG: dephospho-CoA kinase [Flavobacteriaceae bacterium]|nr:dephospho-CoA kinase [Flavobacteriaceae bacterium]